MGARVVVVGSINLDLVVTAERLPSPGETIIGRDFRRFGGGKGANQALAAARMGASVSLIARVGRDDAGRALVQELARGGIDVSRVGQVDGPTGTALISVAASGLNTIIVVPGANALVTPDDVSAACDLIASADVLVAQLEVPIQTVVAAAATAHEAGVPVLVNPSPVQPLPPPLLSQLSYLVVNEAELDALTQNSGDPAELFGAGVQQIVLTLGERGARLIAPEGTHEIAPFAVASVDTTAAGDAFLGAFAATLRERGVDGALDAASAAGALATTKPGAQSSLPTRGEVDLLMRRYQSPGSLHQVEASQSSGS